MSELMYIHPFSSKEGESWLEWGVFKDVQQHEQRFLHRWIAKQTSSWQQKFLCMRAYTSFAFHASLCKRSTCKCVISRDGLVEDWWRPAVAATTWTFRKNGVKPSQTRSLVTWMKVGREFQPHQTRRAPINILWSTVFVESFLLLFLGPSIHLKMPPQDY